MKRIINVIVLLSILFSLSISTDISVSSAIIGDDYPTEYKTASPDTIIDRWNFWNRECTSFVAWRMDSQNGIHDFNNTHLTVNGKYYSIYLGHASNWGTAFENAGFAVNTTPAIGTIAWTKNGTYGHVAWVSEVNGENVTVEEYNAYPNNWAYNSPQRKMTVSEWVNSGYKFIHVKDLVCSTHSWDKGVITKQPTCKKNGEKTYNCIVCGETKKETIKASSKYHKYKVASCVNATLHANGKLLKKCKHCGKTVKSTIYHPKTIKLKKVKYTYKGKAITPTVIIKNTKGKEIPSKYYSVSYKNNKNVGIAKAIISFKTRYSGSSTLKFMIEPKGTCIAKLTAGVKSFKVKWKKQAKQTSGYQIQYAMNRKFTKEKKTVTVKSSGRVSKKIKKLKATTRYYVRVRTYKQLKSIKYYSAWSNTKSIKTKKPADSKDILLGKIKKQTNIDISRTYYADYDGDGKKELFAIAGELGYTNGEKQIWFASTKQVKCLSSGTYMFIYSSKQVKINNKQKMFIAETGAGGSGSTSLWYYVKSSKVKEKPSSSYWCGLTQIKGAEFYSVGQNYDHWTGNGMGGHTYKRYYFKWNGKKFIEYVGTKISKDKLKTYKNASSFLNTIKSLGFKVGTIYKRTNGIININIYQSDGNGSTKNENINLKLKNKKVTLIVINKSGANIIEKSSFGGIYKSKISLEPY